MTKAGLTLRPADNPGIAHPLSSAHAAGTRDGEEGIRVGDTRRSKAVVTRSELVARLALASPHLSLRDVELAVRSLLAHMTEALASGQRVELRGFGSFSRHYHAPRVGRNPRTGDPVAVPGKYVLRFKPGKALREQINGGHAAGAASNREPQNNDPSRLRGARNPDRSPG